MNKLSIYSLLLAAGCAFTACSSDDDGANSAGKPGAINVSKTPGVLTTEDGSQVKITSADGSSVSYDTQGRIKSVGSLKFSYNPFTISYGSYEKYSDIKQNSNGYITSMKFSDTPYDREASCKMSYDGSGHLLKLSASVSEDVSSSTNTTTATVNTELTWSKENLQKIVRTVTKQEDGKSSTDKYTYVFGYRSSGNSNTVHQYNPFIAEALLEWGDYFYTIVPEELCLLGYFGVAGNNHPSSVECTRESSDRSNDAQSEYSFSYSFNNDGTLRSGSYNCTYSSGNTYNLYYPSSFSYSYKEYYDNEDNTSTTTSVSKAQLLGTWKSEDNGIFVLSANGTLECRAEDNYGNWETIKGTWTLSDGTELTLNVILGGTLYQLTYNIKSLTNGKLVLILTSYGVTSNSTWTWYKQ